MNALLIVLVCTIIVILCFIILGSFNNDAISGNLSPTPVIYLNGCLNYQSGVKIKIQANFDKITVDKKYYISIQRISEMKITKTKQLTEQQKNIIGRAVIGTLITGGIGGIIGGISGLGTTKNTEDIEILYVTYMDINDIEQTMSFALMNLAEKSFFLNSWIYGMIERINKKKCLSIN